VKRLAQCSVVIGMLLLMMCQLVYSAERKYNAMTGHWETVEAGSSLRLNAMTGQWSEQPDDSEVEYNAMENTWDWSSGHGNQGGEDEE
jgi:hypothetical protein